MLDIIRSPIRLAAVARIAPPIILSDAQTQEPRRTCRATTSAQTKMLRARIVLLAAKGWPNEEIAHELSTNKILC